MKPILEKITIPDKLIKSSCAFIYFLILLQTQGFAQKEKPNIIFIMCDDLGFSDLSCYGNPYNETPNIDKLAKKGMIFSNFYASSPVCSPSRASILTGKNPTRLGITNFLVGERTDPKSKIKPAKWTKALSSNEALCSERLKSLGYNTAMVGKWHLGGGQGESSWEQGFDFARQIGRNGLDYYNYSIFENDYKKEFVDSGKVYLTDKLTDYSLEFIEQQKAETPFFLYLAYSAPHVFTIPRGDKLAKYLRKYEKFDGAYNPNYAAMLESVDDGVGIIVQKLKEKNLENNTIIVFTSDNGGVGLPELGPTPTNHIGLKKWKGHLYEGGIKIPMIVNWVGKIDSNSTNNNVLVNTDFYNTFLEIAGEKEDQSVESKSFKASLLYPNTVLESKPILWHYPHFSNQLGRPSSAIRVGDWKLIKFYENNRYELYNIKNDQGEKINLASKNLVKTKELKLLLEANLKEMNANMPIEVK